MSRRRARGRGRPAPAAEPAPEEEASSATRRLAARLGDPALEAVDWRVVGVLLLSAVLLSLYAYVGEDDFYLAVLAPRLGVGAGGAGGSDPRLVAFGYQSASAVLWRIAVPLAWIVLVLRDRPAEYGFRLPERGHRAVYALLFAGMLPVLAAVSFLPSFRSMYPIWAEAYGDPAVLVPYLLAYGVRFAAVEAFFRGFLLFALFRRFGYHAVAIMAVPYCMIHFGKPFAEALGSIAAGLLLGYLALRGRSWVPGALLHWGIAVAMDLLGLAQRHLNP